MYALRVYITTQGLAYDARNDFLLASAGRLPVTNHAKVTNADLTGFPLFTGITSAIRTRKESLSQLVTH